MSEPLHDPLRRPTPETVSQRPETARGALGRRGAAGLVALAGALAGCLAPPPPIVVETAFGDVRANTSARAEHVAGLLEGLAPRVREILPGCQERSIDVWVQEDLRVHRFSKRPESVRGFTLLSGEFDARRIHLQEQGQSPWYLGHELVHALIGKSWSTLPGILEEGLADAIAERLAPRYRTSIRAHRLLNATAFSNGLLVNVGYDEPGPTLPATFGRRPSHQRVVRLQVTPPVDIEIARELLRTSRADLHRRWSEIPESFYGFSWLLVTLIADRVGIEGLHGLCLRAADEGLELVPEEWLLAAAGIELEEFDAEFVTSCFGRLELQQAAYLRPDAFAKAAQEALSPIRGSVSPRDLFQRARPALMLPDGSGVPLSAIDPVRESLADTWRH